MTGRYSTRTGVWHTIMGRSLLDRHELTMADAFAANGYRTGIFGKWHLGDNYPFRPQDRGFQEIVVHGGGGVGQTPDFWGNDYFDDTYWHNGRPQKYTGYCTDVFFAEALRFIRECADARQPFFCYIPTNAAHGPYHVPEHYAKPYIDAGVPQPTANFYGMITNADENIGRLLERLGTWGLLKNTLIIFLTDNGTAAGYITPRRRRRQAKPFGYNAGMRGKKGSQYEGGHRVPCFVYWQGRIEGGRDVERLAGHFDLLPTLVDLCGLKLPRPVKFDGRSLVPLLRGDEAGWPDRTLFVHSQRVDRPIKWRKCAVMTERWRLIDGKELYDIKADPGQRHDVAGEHPDVVKRLRAAYERWWQELEPRFDRYCRIVFGSEHENPARLTCHDWHGKVVPWNQRMISNPKLYANGFWAVELARAGRYRFTLRRWPKGVAGPIDAVRARLTIDGVDVEKSVPDRTQEVSFDLRLPAGPAKLRTELTAANGKSRGAYYVYVQFLGGE